ncbi:MAG: phosphotransferase [Paracoccaceae bacterium]|nr:phosphotransferase [Paracoccaceae bacterium]MDE2912655.1 phosphotransferase [Paracoccaceae bacterium]
MTCDSGDDRIFKRVEALPIWSGPVSLTPLGGGITNVNVLADDGVHRYAVRLGDDIPIHHVMRFNELAASRAAHAAGISPAVIHHQPGILILDYVDGRTLEADDIADVAMLERILPLVVRCHRDIPGHLRGPALIFWVFHVVRDYAATLETGNSGYGPLLPDLLAAAEKLEATVSPVDLVFGHNDLLAANFLDDGDRLWLIDWDYAGFNSPLFDIGGLASNNGLDSAQEIWLLENYFERPVQDSLLRRYHAMKCASLLRESLWSMVSEIHSSIDFDYRTYTEDNLRGFRSAYDLFLQS